MLYWAKKTCPLLKVEFSHSFSERMLALSEANLGDADQEIADLRNAAALAPSLTIGLPVQRPKGKAKGTGKGGKTGDGRSGWMERCCALMIAVCVRIVPPTSTAPMGLYMWAWGYRSN